MFKRVEKKRKKREEEEELGLDEDMKEILGINETDSEESDSDSDDQSSSSERGEEENEEGDIDPEDDEEESEEDGVEDDDEAEQPFISVQEALRDPLFLVSIQPDIKACVVCPGRRLKGSQMTDVHKKSNAFTQAHERRFVQLQAKAAAVEDKQSNVWDIMEQLTTKPIEQSAPGETSKRAEKRKARQATLKAKRMKRKALAQEKKDKEPAGPANASGQPTTKKRKTEKPLKAKKVDADAQNESDAPPNSSNKEDLSGVQRPTPAVKPREPGARKKEKIAPVGGKTKRRKGVQ